MRSVLLLWERTNRGMRKVVQNGQTEVRRTKPEAVCLYSERRSLFVVRHIKTYEIRVRISTKSKEIRDEKYDFR